jgi:hypothetical protein
MFHILTSVITASGHRQFLVLGSQAILCHCRGKTRDYAFDQSKHISISSIPPDDALSEFIDRTFGEDSMFHRTHGYYAHGVNMAAAVFPHGWENRLTSVQWAVGANGRYKATACYPSAEDLMISKAGTGRGGDLIWIRDLVREKLVNKAATYALLQQLPASLSEEDRELVAARIRKTFEYFNEEYVGKQPPRASSPAYA